MGSTADVAASVLEGWHTEVQRLLASRIGQEVLRLEQAYVVLTGAPAPEFLFAGKTFDAAPTVATPPPSTARDGSFRSVAERALTSEPRLWTYDELAGALETAGLDVRDPNGRVKSSLRTAIWTLVNKSIAKRGPDGTVYAAAHHDELTASGVLAPNTIFPTFSPDDLSEGGDDVDE